MRTAKFGIGQMVRHRSYPFRGVVFDVDAQFNNSQEWWLSIPEHLRPTKDQPFYHLLAENEDAHYIAYVSEQNLEPDEEGDLVTHPQLDATFEKDESGYHLRKSQLN